MEPEFRVVDGVIQIVNGRGRSGTIVLIVLAVGIALVPLLPPGMGETAGLVPCILGACLCLMAAFWWSEVTIDPAAGQVLIVRRWGLWVS